MSVNWNCADTAAYKAVVDLSDEDEAVKEFRWLRDSLIWALLVTGFPKGGWFINESNWQEVYIRLNLLERTLGVYRQSHQDGKTTNHFFTPAEVRSFIGLSVNAGNKSDAEFHKHLIRRMREMAQQRIDAS